MANQRKKGIERVTVTMPDELLSRIETEAKALGIDRLALMRQILEKRYQAPKSSSSEVKRNAKK